MKTRTAPTTPAPFWHRLRAITLYPVRGAAMYTLIALTFASLLGMIPIVGWVISILTWLAAYKYAFEILRATADGHMEAPETVLDMDDGVVWRLIALQLVSMVLVLLALGLFGPVVGLLVLLVVALMQPGCIMSLAIDGSFTHAINPATSFGVIARVGWPYLAVFALLFVIQASAATAGSWLSQVMPPVLGNLTLTLFAFWGIFAAFHLMGYLVYQFHEDLGYEPESHRNRLPPLANRDRDLLDLAEGHVRENRADVALALLREEIRSRSVSLETHELYHRLLRQGTDTAAQGEHARQYLNLLMMEKQDRRALTLLRDALDAQPDFEPMQLADAEHLVERARLSGQSQLAVDLLRSLLRNHPRNASAPRWGLDAALLLVDRFGRDDEARELLDQAQARCEDPALRAKLEAALKPLAALRTSPA